MGPGSPRGAVMLADARELAVPRYPGTAANRRAAELVARKLGEAGLEVREEAFRYDIRRALRAIRLVLGASAVLLGLAAWLALRSPAPALGVLAASGLVGGVLLVWAPGAERLYRGGGPTETWNITGWRRASRPRLTLILLAHYDSKSQNLSLPFRMGFTLGAILGAAGMAVALCLRAAGIAVGPEWLGSVTGLVAALSLIALSTLDNGNASPGGVDNAGSVALLFELARILPHRLPADVELVFLAPGAEEDHMVGAMRWLDAHRAEFRGRPVRALNFDGAGAPGRPVILESYGLVHRFAPEIARVARRVAERQGLKLRRIWLPPAMGVDAIPFHHRGVPCLTFSSGSLGRATLAVHSAHDVADHLDAAALETVARLGLDVSLELGNQGQQLVSREAGCCP